MEVYENTLLKVCVFGYLVGGFLHLLGLVLLCKVRMSLQNQQVILTNIAIIEMLFGFLNGTLECVSQFFPQRLCRAFQLVHLCLVSFLLTIYHLVMLHLILDRFCDIWFHLRYPLMFTKQRLKVVLASLWLVSAIFALTTVLISYCQNDHFQALRYMMYCQGTLDIMIVIGAIATYTYLFCKVKTIISSEASLTTTNNSNNNNNNNNNNNSNNNNNITGKGSVARKFLVPCIMIATFIGFMITSACLATVSHMKSEYAFSVDLYALANVFAICGIVSDAFIYILLQRDVRNLLKSTLKSFTMPPLFPVKTMNIQNQMNSHTTLKENTSSVNTFD